MREFVIAGVAAGAFMDNAEEQRPRCAFRPGA